MTKQKKMQERKRRWRRGGCMTSANCKFLWEHGHDDDDDKDEDDNKRHPVGL